MTIAVPYFEQAQDQGLQFLQAPQGATLPAEYQDCETGSVVAPGSISKLLVSSEETFFDAGPVPKTPDTSPRVKRKQLAPQQPEQQRPAVQEGPVDTTGDLRPGGKKQPVLQSHNQEGNGPLEDLQPGKRREGQPGCPEPETATKPSEDWQRKG